MEKMNDEWPFEFSSLGFNYCRLPFSGLTHLAECRGATLGDLRLQDADKLAELHAVVELLHEELGPHLLFCLKKTKTKVRCLKRVGGLL